MSKQSNYKIKNSFEKIIFALLFLFVSVAQVFASSHREAPLIANDPLADNTDLYAFRSPDNPNMITLIATYVPGQLPHGGPNYYSFGENIRYEIHVDNDASVHGDEIIYRFTFSQVNEDPTTFFNIRLGAQNLKTTYMLERTVNGGQTWETIVTNGMVPPPNIGPRSIESGVGLGSSYSDLFSEAITMASTGERVFAGPVDDPFFVDLGGIFDLGDAPRQNGTPRDGLACLNVSAIAIQVPISTLLKDGASPTPVNILDPDYVIGVWASASRRAIRTLTPGGETHSGDWVQVSRLGMPLTNEAVIPIGQKDFWNAISPYDEISETTLDEYFFNPELGLYMDDDLFGGAVPSFAPLRIQRNALGSFDFGNGNDGLYVLKGNPALAGTALDDAVFGNLLLPAPGKPRAVDLWAAFHTGVPNVIPYQLATGKNGNPLAAGKPFVHNFLPNGGDMLRLNMATPVTPRDHDQFSSEGLIQAAVLGLVDPTYNQNADIQWIPNMDGFPNGRRLEDDVTRIELQAVSGVVLAAIGLWYDDFDPNTGNPVTQDLLDVLTFSTGVEKNDRTFRNSFPYLAMPNSGTSECGGIAVGPDGGAPNENDINDCPDQLAGFEYLGEFDGHRYFLSTEKEKPVIAQEFAMSNGGYLAVINSEAENDFIQSNISEMTYIGLNDTQTEGNLMWVNGDPLDYTNFDICSVCTGNAPKLDFVKMHFWNGGWSYSSGFSSRKYIIEFDCSNNLTDDDDTNSLIVPDATSNGVGAQQSPLGLSGGKVFPVPVNDLLSIEFTSDMEKKVPVQIFDMSGKKVFTQEVNTQIGANQVAVNVATLQSGMYFISIPGQTGNVLKMKFVKQ